MIRWAGTLLTLLTLLAVAPAADAAPPAPVIDSPAEGAVVHADPVHVHGTGTVGAHVEVSADGQPRASTDIDGTGEWALDVGGLADGAHTLTATATDATGTSPASTPVHITTDVNGSFTTFTVTGTTDTTDPCAGVECPSLRSALAAAKADAGPETITLPAGQYTLTQGTLAVDSPVTIDGAGARATAIVNAGSTTLAISDTALLHDLRLQGGLNGIAATGNTLALDHVAVEGMTEDGIDALGASLAIDHSVISGNGGSGVAALGTTTSLSLDTTTVADNGIGIKSTGGANSALSLRQVTVALNHTGGTTVGQAGFTAAASIIANNTGANCVDKRPTSNGGNVESGTDCGFSAAEDRQNADPRLAAALVADGQTDVLPLSDGSPAIDLVPTCGPTDQRDGTRPLGAACDAGAYEATPAPHDTTIDSGPPALTSSRAATFTFHATPAGASFRCSLDGGAESACASPQTYNDLADGSHTFTVRADGEDLTQQRTWRVDSTPPPAPEVTAAGDSAFTFSSSESDASFECRLDGPLGEGTFAPCTSPYSHADLAPGDYAFLVRAVDGAGNRGVSERRAFTVARASQLAASPAPAPALPAPVFGQTVVVKPISGKVLVRRSGSTAFAELGATSSVPLGSTIDTKHGVIALQSAPKPGGRPQRATFFGGIFEVTQSGARIDLTLNEPLAACPKRGKAAAAAQQPKTRHLSGDGSGSFRTAGRYSAATVRGTKWLVEDSCQGTLTRVTQGLVAVRDNVRRRTVLVRAGKRYLAKPAR